MLFRNFYRCAACHREWTDVWSAQCDDDCPHCGARHMSPYKSEDVDDAATTTRIRELNDAFRRSFNGGLVTITAGVHALPGDTKERLFQAVRSFETFDADTDPHHEHDFGTIEIGDERFFWKIEYYDRELRCHSPDPTYPEQTLRVMTIMLASEY